MLEKSTPGLPSQREEQDEEGIACQADRALQIAQLRRQLMALSDGGRLLRAVLDPCHLAAATCESPSQTSGSFREFMFSTCSSERVVAPCQILSEKRRLPEAPPLSEQTAATGCQAPELQVANARASLQAAEVRRLEDDEDLEAACELYRFHALRVTGSC